MQRMTYSQPVKAAIVEQALEARSAGKTWSETCLLAKSVGFKGSVSSLQKLVNAAKDNAVGALKTAQPASNKGSAKALKGAATGANAFTKTGAATAPKTAAAPAAKKNAAPNLPALKNGVKYARPISLFDGDFRIYGEGELDACSHIHGRAEVLRLVNSNPAHPRGADVVVDCTLSPAGSVLTVVSNSAQARDPKFNGTHPVGTQVPVKQRWDGTTYVSIREVGPAEVLILSN